MCILPKHEDSVTEFKLLWCDSAKKTLCAFLNGRGGTIWFGLNDAGEPIGLAEPDVVSNAVTNTFRGMHPDASAYFETHIEEVEGKPLVLVKVFPGKSTPYKVDVRGEGCRAYVRRGSSTYLASEEELLELTRQGDPTPWEAYPAREQNLTFEATRRVFERHYVEFSSRTEEILMLRARSNGPWTNLAYLLSDQNKFKTRFAIFNGLNKAAPIAAMLDADVIVLGTPVYFYSMSAQLKTLIDRCCARYTELSNKEFYLIMTAAERDIEAMQPTVAVLRGFLDCLDKPVERGIIYGLGVWQAGEVKSMPAMREAYEAGAAV